MEQILLIKKNDKETVNISINNNEMLMTIVGQFDQNLKTLSKLTKTVVYFRGNSITCKGKKENLSIEISDLVQLPDQMLENIKKFDEQLIQAIKDQKNSEDDVVRKETEIRDIEKEQKDESLNLEIYKTENIKMESELNIIKSKVDIFGVLFDEPLKTVDMLTVFKTNLFDSKND